MQTIKDINFNEPLIGLNAQIHDSKDLVQVTLILASKDEHNGQTKGSIANNIVTTKANFTQDVNETLDTMKAMVAGGIDKDAEPVIRLYIKEPIYTALLQKVGSSVNKEAPAQVEINYMLMLLINNLTELEVNVAKLESELAKAEAKLETPVTNN